MKARHERSEQDNVSRGQGDVLGWMVVFPIKRVGKMREKRNSGDFAVGNCAVLEAGGDWGGKTGGDARRLLQKGEGETWAATE